MGGAYLFIFAWSEPFIAFETSSTACFNAFGKSLPPAVNSVVFNLLRIPLGFLFMQRWGAYGIWFVMSMTSLAKGFVIGYLLFRLHRQYSSSSSLSLSS